MKLYAGTSGFSYKEWKGPFYPEKIKNDEMLAYYASKLSTVEINNTFYRMPRASVLEGWAEQVPENFRFVLKASRRITHFKRLNDTGELLGYLFETTAVLDDRLGVVFFQLPPNFKKEIEKLGAFLDELPGNVKAAFEFRHPSWQCDAVNELLRARDHALVLADVDDEDRETGIDSEIISTANWGYLRLRRDSYSDADLADWARRIQSQGWSDSFVFLKHEDRGPQFAATLLEQAAKPGARKVAAKPRKRAQREDDAQRA